MNNPTPKELYQWIANEAENLKSEESRSPFLVGRPKTNNFDWRQFQLKLFHQIMERHAEVLANSNEEEIRDAIYLWWSETAPVTQLREQAEYLRMSIQYGHDTEEWLAIVDELEQLASARERSEQRNPPSSGDN